MYLKRLRTPGLRQSKNITFVPMSVVRSASMTSSSYVVEPPPPPAKTVRFLRAWPNAFAVIVIFYFLTQESRRNSSSRKPSDSTQRSDEIQPVQRKKHAAPQRRPSAGKETVNQDRCRTFTAFVRILRRYA